MKYFSVIKTPVGFIKIIAENECVTDIFFLPDSDNEPQKENPSELTIIAATQLSEYFGGKRKSFDFPFYCGKQGFSAKVSKALMEIPYGETVTYKQIAEKCGNPKAARAVGASVGSNRIMIVIPCHRVVGSNGSLTGYAYGVEVKKYLLELEKRYL